MLRKSPRMTRYLWGGIPWLLVILLLLFSILLGMMVSKKKSEIDESRENATSDVQPSINVVIQKIVPETVTDRINLPAIVNPWEDLMVNAEVEGIVVKLYVKEGDRVKKNDIILKIDERDYKIDLKNINAAYKLALLNNNRLETPSYIIS